MNPSRIRSNMKYQIDLLEDLDELLQYCEQHGCLDTVSNAKVELLQNHIIQMQMICDVAIDLTDKVASEMKKVKENDKPEKVKADSKKSRKNKTEVQIEDPQNLDFLD